MTRTSNDWSALVFAELDGKEPPGTVGRLIAEATGKAVAAVGADVDGLLKLAEALASPATVRKAISDYRTASLAAQADKAAAVKAKADAEADLARQRREHDLALSRERKDQEAAMTAGRAELEAAKVQANNLLAKAKADAEVAARLKDKAARKLAAFESVT